VNSLEKGAYAHRSYPEYVTIILVPCYEICTLIIMKNGGVDEIDISREHESTPFARIKFRSNDLRMPPIALGNGDLHISAK
jgi:hypothetical protein